MAGSKSIGDLFVTVSAKPKKFNAALTKAEKRAKKFKDTVTKSFHVSGLAAAAMGTAVAFGIGKVIMAASDLEETASKFDTVFEGQEKRAEAWSDTLVNAYAMSTREAKFYLSSVQDLLVPMGVNAKLAGELSNEVVKLSADLGSFNNLPTAQVMEDMQSALVGNFETMKKYGIVLNETVVAQKALELGLAETKSELTAGMKAQAAYALMVEGSAAAVGDMERTSEGYANQTKLLMAQVEDLAAAIGNEFLPLATKTVGVLSDLVGESKLVVDWFSKMSGSFGLASAGVITWGQAMKDGAVWADKFASDPALTDLESKLETVTKSFNKLENERLRFGAGAKIFFQHTKELEGYKQKIIEVQDQIAARKLTIESDKTAAGDAAKVAAEAKAVADARIEAEKKVADAIKAENIRIRAIRTKNMADFKESAGEGYEFQRSLIDKRKADLLIAFQDEANAVEIVTRMMADDYQELEDQKVAEREAEAAAVELFKEQQQEKLLALGSFADGVGVGLEQLAENARTIAEIGAETTAMLFNSVTSGIGKSVARSIVDGQSMAKSMKAVMKSAASDMIANLVKIGVQRLVLKSINVGATVAEHKANSAVSVADTFSNAYAATAKIPIVGPILAPIVAAAAAAAALSGISSWGSKGAEGAVSVAHGGLSSVPSEQTFLLDKGERVLSPSQNEDLTEFLANNGGGSPNVTFNITAFDSETMTDTVRNTIIPMLQDALTLNSENFRDSIQTAVA